MAVNRGPLPEFFEAAVLGRATNQVVAFERARSLQRAIQPDISTLIDDESDPEEDEISMDEANALVQRDAFLSVSLEQDPSDAPRLARAALGAHAESREYDMDALLAFISMRGNWRRADEVEVELRENAWGNELFPAGYRRLEITQRDTQEARTMHIFPGIIDEKGLVAIVMSRLFLTASSENDEISIYKDSSHVVNVDKIMEMSFIVDGEDDQAAMRAELARRAMHELRTIILAAKVHDLNLTVLRTLHPQDMLDDAALLRRALGEGFIFDVPALGDVTPEIEKVERIKAEMRQYVIVPSGLITTRLGIGMFTSSCWLLCVWVTKAMGYSPPLLPVTGPEKCFMGHVGRSRHHLNLLLNAKQSYIIFSVVWGQEGTQDTNRKDTPMSHSDTDADDPRAARFPAVDEAVLAATIVVDLTAHAVPAAVRLLVAARDDARQYGQPGLEFRYEVPEGDIDGPGHGLLDVIMPDDQTAVPSSLHDRLNRLLLGDEGTFIHTKGAGGYCEVVIAGV